MNHPKRVKRVEPVYLKTYETIQIYAWLICAKRLGVQRDCARLIAKELYKIDYYFDGERGEGIEIFKALQTEHIRVVVTDKRFQVCGLLAYLLVHNPDYRITISPDKSYLLVEMAKLLRKKDPKSLERIRVYDGRLERNDPSNLYFDEDLLGSALHATTRRFYLRYVPLLPMHNKPQIVLLGYNRDVNASKLRNFEAVAFI